MGLTILKTRLFFMCVPFLAAMAWMGFSGSAKHYDRSPHDVKMALASAYVPTHVLGSYVAGSEVTLPDNDTVVTALIDDEGYELARFVTTVLPDGEGSSVSTEVQPPRGAHAERAEKAMKSQVIAMAMLEKVAEEHVAATIEGRPFDMLAMNPAAKAMAGAVPGMSAQIDQANEAAAEFSRMEQDHDGGYDDSWGDSGSDYAGGWGE